MSINQAHYQDGLLLYQGEQYVKENAIFCVFSNKNFY